MYLIQKLKDLRNYFIQRETEWHKKEDDKLKQQFIEVLADDINYHRTILLPIVMKDIIRYFDRKGINLKQLVLEADQKGNNNDQDRHEKT